MYVILIYIYNKNVLIHLYFWTGTTYTEKRNRIEVKEMEEVILFVCKNLLLAPISSDPSRRYYNQGKICHSIAFSSTKGLS